MAVASQSTDVVISGGGIGGAVLAELLARSGKRVLVLERNTAPPNFLRPELLWPSSIDVLSSIHPRTVWESEATLPVRGLRATIGGEPFSGFDARLLDEIDVHPWFVNPNDARELLLRRASFQLRRGVEVLATLNEGERIVGLRARERSSGSEFDVRATLTIGDDGEHSIVRKGCKIEIATEPFPFEFLCFGFDWPAKFEPGVARVWIHPRPRESGIVALGAMPFVGGRAAGLVPIRGDVLDANAHLEAAWREFIVLDPLMREVVGERAFPRDMTRVSRRFGHAPRYGAPGAFLLGDAAHPVSPAGGQGANMSIADARVLAKLLIDERADPLAEYERSRRPANERSVAISRNATRALALPRGFVSTTVFAAARLLGRRRSVVKRFLRAASRSFDERGG